MSIDVNLYSFNGPHDNGRTVEHLDEITTTPNIADTIKCSTGLANFEGLFGIVHSGYEDVVDVNNRCQYVNLKASLWVLNRCRMGFTVKGGSSCVRLSGPVRGHGREVDIDLGNASDQSHELTEGVVLNLWPENQGDYLTVRVLGAKLPLEEPGSGPYRYIYPWKNKLLRVFSVKAFLEWRRIMKRFKR